MNRLDVAMSDSDTDGSLGIYLVLALAMIISIGLAKAGILKKAGVNGFAKGAGVFGGVLYALSFKAERSISPVVDFVAIAGMGIVVGFILFAVFLMAAGFATEDEPTTTDTQYVTASTLPHRGMEGNLTADAGEDWTTLVISCPTCGQKLRVPAGKSQNVTCAKCRTQFVVPASGENAPNKFRIIESVGSGSASKTDKSIPNLDRPSIIVFRCKACGLERNISPDAEGFHCAGCKQYSNVRGSSANLA